MSQLLDQAVPISLCVCVCVFVKQQIQQLTNDNSTVKLKLRRLEEDYIKKVSALLFPSLTD